MTAVSGSSRTLDTVTGLGRTLADLRGVIRIGTSHHTRLHGQVDWFRVANHKPGTEGRPLRRGALGIQIVRQNRFILKAMLSLTGLPIPGTFECAFLTTGRLSRLNPAAGAIRSS